MPKSAVSILRVLTSFGKASRREILIETKMPERTVRYALGVLKRKGLVREFLDFDARSRIYEPRGGAFE